MTAFGLYQPEALAGGCWLPPEEPAGTLMPLRPTVEILREQPRLIQEAVSVNTVLVDALAAIATSRNVDRILAVGSGDSLHVAEAAVQNYATYAHMDGVAMNAQTYATHGYFREGPSTLRFLISATGRRSEATDALTVMRNKSAGRTVLVGDAPKDSPFSEERPGETSLRTYARHDQPHIPSATTLSAHALLLDTALAIGSGRGVISSHYAEDVREDVLRNNHWMGSLSHISEQWARDVVDHMPDSGAIALLGEGNDYIAAKMGDSLMAGGPQISRMHLELAEQDHAFKLEPILPGQPVVIMATEGFTAYHESLFRKLENTGRYPIVIGSPYDMPSHILVHPNVFPTVEIPKPANIIGAAIVLQWLAVMLASRRVQEGHARKTSADVMDEATRQRHIDFFSIANQ